MQVFWFKDSKVGHLKQVKALLDELKKEIEFYVTPVECKKNLLSAGNEDISSLLSGADENVLLIGAGHATYPKIIQSNKILKTHQGTRSLSVSYGDTITLQGSVYPSLSLNRSTICQSIFSVKRCL